MDYEIVDAPKELEHLIIYEIATKNYTSPNGAESGTFTSLMEKLPYLEELGINAIWLSGHQLCESHHFYNIWNEYACIRPDRLDPSLGSETEFKQLIESAHQHGILVFLDVITHGVMKDSSLVREHPEWFSGESWGMRDFDWYGGHADLDEWWVNTWFRYVTEYGIDGFRLDVAHYRNDLWALLRRRTKEWGKQIVIIAESGPAIKGVVDILQHGEEIAHNYGVNRSCRILYDAAGYCLDRQSRVNERYDVRIFYEDGTLQDSGHDTWYQEEKVPEVIWLEAATRIVECDEPGIAYQLQLGQLRIENIWNDKTICNVEIRDKQGHHWNSNLEGVLEVDYKVTWMKKGRSLYAEFPLRIQDGQYLSIQLSCHDGGWVGYELGDNPYTAKGSRYLAGYTALLAPGIPVFMSGEEFNADYRPLPGLSPGLFGGEPYGEGHWLYGSWIDWAQLENPEKADMLADMKCIIGIRRRECNLIKPCKMGERHSGLGTVEYEAAEELPIPYFYKGDGKVIVICANPDTKQDVFLRLQLKSVLEEEDVWQATVLYGEEPDMTTKRRGEMTGEGEEPRDRMAGTAEELDRVIWKIKRDGIHQGGLLVIKYERREQ